MCTHTTHAAERGNHAHSHYIRCGEGEGDHAHSHYTRCGEGEGEGESYTCCGRVVWELLVNIPNCLNQPARGRDERLLVCLFACLFVYHTWTTPCAPGSPLCWPLLPCPYLDLLTVPPDIKKTPVKRHILINMLFTLASCVCTSVRTSVSVCLSNITWRVTLSEIPMNTSSAARHKWRRSHSCSKAWRNVSPGLATKMVDEWSGRTHRQNWNDSLSRLASVWSDWRKTTTTTTTTASYDVYMIKIHNCQDHFHLYCEQPVMLNFFEKLSEVRFGDWQVRDCKVVTQGVTLFNSGVTTWRNSH